MIALNASRIFRPVSPNTAELRSHVLEETFDVLVVTGGLGTSPETAYATLTALGKPVIWVPSPIECAAGQSLEDLEQAALKLFEHTNVIPLLNRTHTLQGINFVGITEFSQPSDARYAWLLEVLLRQPRLPTVIASTKNPLAGQEQDFLKSRAVQPALLLPPEAALSCFAWLHADTAISSMRLSQDGVAVAGCTGHLTRPAFGAPSQPFNILTIREELQLKALGHLKAALAANCRALEGCISHSNENNSVAPLLAYETCRSIHQQSRGEPFLSAEWHHDLMVAREAMAQGDYRQGLEQVKRLLATPDDILVLNRKKMTDARKRVSAIVEFVLRAEGVPYVVAPLTLADSYRMVNQPLTVTLGAPGATSGLSAVNAVERYLFSLKSAIFQALASSRNDELLKLIEVQLIH